MKDSGNKWIGIIPCGWSIDRFKYCTVLYTGNSIKDERKNDYEDASFAKPYISSKDINRLFSTINYENGLYIKNNDYSFKVARKNDILMCIEGGSAGKKKAMLNQDVCFVNKLCCFHSNYKVEHKFIFYYLCNPAYEDEFNYNITGMIGGVSVSKLGDLNIVYPEIDEQKRIVVYLDEQCKKIDEIMVDIQNQIDTLEDYKKSIIFEAVTKGLDPNAVMKDSGITFVGKIPAHWELHPVYYYFSEGKIKNTGCTENNLLSLSYGNIIRKDINTSEGLLPASFSTYNIVEKDDIIIRPTDLQNDKRSLRTGLVKEKGIITSAYIDLKPKTNVNSRYFHYLLHSYDVKKVFYNMGNGVRQGLNFGEFSKLSVFNPSIKEQEEIAEYLDSKCAKIDSIIEDKKAQLETIENYKKSLIYEYVTGKKEVPENE